MSQYEVEMFNLIEERSGGKVKFTTYWASSLIPDEESWTAFLSGACDVLHWVASEDYQPLNWGIMNMPFIGWPSMEGGSEINLKLLDKYPQMMAEFKGAEIITTKMMPPVQIHTVNKAVITPADLKGMKIICTGLLAKVVNSVGGVPVEVQPGDMYTSLEAGLVEGNINHWPVVSVFGTLPLYNYHTNFGDGGIQMLPFGVVANANFWSKLTPDIQKIMKDTAHEIWYVKGFEIEYAEITKYTNQAKEWGHEIINLTPDQIKVWQDAAKPLQDGWIAELEAKGYPARDIFNDSKQMIAQYHK
jgi:TRAP-type C4-dicarboxylate transport system substrate-binding protein